MPAYMLANYELPRQSRLGHVIIMARWTRLQKKKKTNDNNTSQ
jgi:hypothetical protein